MTFLTNYEADEDDAVKKPTDYEVIAAMALFGGSFVERLAEAYNAGDEINRARIRIAFPEIWSTYEDLAKQRKRQSANG